MRRIIKYICSGLLVAILSTPALASYKSLNWIDLMPKSDIEKLQNMPEVNHEVDEIIDLSQFKSVKPELNKTKVKIPGYIVPLEYNAQQETTEFFLVPYFGACIHVPPPPPNQMIHVTLKNGLSVDQLHLPFWIEGELLTETQANEVGAASYSLNAHNAIIYEEG